MVRAVIMGLIISALTGIGYWGVDRYDQMQAEKAKQLQTLTNLQQQLDAQTESITAIAISYEDKIQKLRHEAKVTAKKVEIQKIMKVDKKAKKKEEWTNELGSNKYYL